MYPGNIRSISCLVFGPKQIGTRGLKILKWVLASGAEEADFIGLAAGFMWATF